MNLYIIAHDQTGMNGFISLIMFFLDQKQNGECIFPKMRGETEYDANFNEYFQLGYNHKLKA